MAPDDVADHDRPLSLHRLRACVAPIRDGTGPARLLDMVEGRSKQVFKTWLGERDTPWRDGVEVVAMDGFTGSKTATSEELPDAVAVMDPFHVVGITRSSV